MNSPKRKLNLFDSTCLIAGIILGAGVYQMAPSVAQSVSSPGALLSIWLAGAFLSLCGALTYAELATTFPEEGGDYVYLTKAYGRCAGFLFGWGQLTVVRPGDIAVMAFIFANYASTIYAPLAPDAAVSNQLLYAVTAVVLLTGLNIVGVKEAKWVQNILTVSKVLGLLVVVGVAFYAPAAEPIVSGSSDSLPFRLAFIFVLFTYGGWNEMVYVAAEVKDYKRNITRALVSGIVAVTVLYLMLNLACLHALGFEGLASSQAMATDAVSTMFPGVGARFVAILICISALSAVHGLIFAGARISFAVGKDHSIFRMVGHWNEKTGTPLRALLLQGAISVTQIVLLGTFLDAVMYTAAAVYSFQLATAISLFVMRRKAPDLERPYRVFGYPWIPLIFCLVCVVLLHAAVTYKPLVAGFALLFFLVGIPFYKLSSRNETGDQEEAKESASNDISSTL